jgi:hypothetical protein
MVVYRLPLDRLYAGANLTFKPLRNYKTLEGKRELAQRGRVVGSPVLVSLLLEDFPPKGKEN